MRTLALEYHDIVPDGDVEASGFPGGSSATYKLDATLFARHLDAIAEAAPSGATTVMEMLKEPVRDRRPLFLTFDDGGIGAVTHTAALLEQRGWRGHFFVTTDRVGTRAFLDKAGIRDLHARGHVIGSHSCSHPPMMARLPFAALLQEWQSSARTLADIIGESVLTASVPGGLYARHVAVAAAHSGLKALFTSEPVTRCSQVEGCLVIGRYTLRRWSSPELASALAAGRLAPRLRQWAVRAVLTNLRRLGGTAYLRARTLLLDRR